MAVAFVALVGADGKALFGPAALFLAGAVAAGLLTCFTFPLSFGSIVAGGLLVESTHDSSSSAPH